MHRSEIYGRQAIAIKALFPNVALLALETPTDGRELSIEEGQELLTRGMSEGRLLVRESTEVLVGGLLTMLNTHEDTAHRAETEIEQARDIIAEDRSLFIRNTAARLLAAHGPTVGDNMIAQCVDLAQKLEAACSELTKLTESEEASDGGTNE